MNFKNFLPAPLPLDVISYRNIYTIYESQDLLDDIISSHNRDNLRSAIEQSKRIEPEVEQKFRVFQYGKKLETWPEFNFKGTDLRSFGRFNGSNFAVWYGALEENTSICERLYHGYQDTIKDVIKFSEKAFIIQYRRMFEVQLSGENVIDLRLIEKFREKLISDNYEFCQELGQFAFKNEIDFYLTPSARKKNGTCTPVFPSKDNEPNFDTIKNESSKYYLEFRYFKDGKAPIVKKVNQEELDLDLEENFFTLK